MDFRLCLFYLASAASLVGLSQAALWGPRDGGRRGRGEVLPVFMDIPDTSGEALSDVAAQAIHPVNRYCALCPSELGDSWMSSVLKTMMK